MAVTRWKLWSLLAKKEQELKNKDQDIQVLRDHLGRRRSSENMNNVEEVATVATLDVGLTPPNVVHNPSLDSAAFAAEEEDGETSRWPGISQEVTDDVENEVTRRQAALAAVEGMQRSGFKPVEPQLTKGTRTRPLEKD